MSDGYGLRMREERECQSIRFGNNKELFSMIFNEIEL